MIKNIVKILIVSLGFIVISCGFSFNSKRLDITPKVLYQVYLDGEVIGTIESKDDLLNVIDKEQESLKNEFKVDKVYPPKGLDIRKVYTYNTKVDSVSSVYNKIKNERPFTIKGYTITININKNKKEKINVLKKSYFDKAIDNTIEAFVPEEKYKKYKEDIQEKITDTGTNIENIDLKEDITFKESYMSTEDKIFTDSDELTRYLLFGTLKKQKDYVVKKGDVLNDIAEKNNLNIEELLIANPDLKSETTLVFPGQKLNIGLIDPILSVVVTSKVVEEQTVKFKTEEIYDKNVVEGTDTVEQNGENGLNKVTFHKEEINGETMNLVVTDTEQITPAINKVIRRGGKKVSGVATGQWGWPTISPYVITSRFGHRWGRLHAGIDVSGCGHGSPIFAADGGTVIETGSNSTEGLYVYVDHHNSYISYYLHLSKISVKTGQNVRKGQVVGAMGNTGRSTGTHLHFGIAKNGRPYVGGTPLDPLQFY